MAFFAYLHAVFTLCDFVVVVAVVVVVPAIKLAKNMPLNFIFTAAICIRFIYRRAINKSHCTHATSGENECGERRNLQ